jgi:hypothetical protein
MKIRTQFQEAENSSGYDNDPGKTMTVPDQGLTITELLDRHSRGVSLGATDRQGEYFDTEIPRFDDLTDALEHKKNLNKKVKYYDNEIKKQKEAKAKINYDTLYNLKDASETVAKPTEK